MSQILIVAGPSGLTVGTLFARAAAVQCALSNAPVADRIESPGLYLATWRRAYGQAPVLEQCAGAWAVGAGAWTGPTALPTLRTRETLNGYEGAFVFAAGTTKDAIVRLATDPLGSLHVYTTRYRGCTLISTSSLALAAVSGADWDINGVREFLAKGSVFGERTLHQGVGKLRPGRIFEFADAEQSKQQIYWSPERPSYGEPSDRNTIVNFVDALKGAVDTTLDAARQPLMDLTGGFDSRLVLAASLQHLTVSELDCTVSGEAGDGDVIAASAIAKAFGLRLHRRPPRIAEASTWWTTSHEALAYTDGEADVLEYADTLSIHRAGMGHFDASINGSGGELIRGYWWELLWPHTGATDRFDTRRVAAARFAHDPWAETLLTANFGDTLTDHFAGVLKTELQGLHGWPNTALMDRLYLYLRMQRWQGRLASATNRIWPCFAPCLFRPVINAALSASVALRRNGRMARLVLQYMNPRLASLPMVDRTPAAPVGMKNFWRHIPRYRSQIKQLRRKLRPRRPAASTSDPRLSALLRLIPVREMLDPANMYAASLYREERLREFFRDADSGHVNGHHLGRIVTLELVARALAKSTRVRSPPGTRQ